MVMSLHRSKKPIALLLVAAVLLGCAYTGINTIRKTVFPKMYAGYVEKYCAVYDIDPNLAYAVIHTESGFDSNAVSPLGACGLMQLMPETFEWLRSKDEGEAGPYTDIFDPETNIRYGVYFLSLLSSEFGDEKLAIAAYHAGMGRVSQWLSDEMLSSDGKTLDTIPFRDTEHYVHKVERAKKIYETLYYSNPNNQGDKRRR